MKKLGKLLLFAAMAALLTCLLCVALNATQYSGTCGAEGDGSNLTWTLDTETGVLKIEGKGAMADYSSSAPWYNYRSSIKTAKIGDGVTSIGDRAFGGCSSLTSITIPDSVTSIRGSAFRGCRSLTNINVDKANKSYKSIDSVLFTKDGKTLIVYPAGNAGTMYTIPSGVTSIGDYAFWDCRSLTSTEIPNSVTSIGDFAFTGCTNLTSIEIPSSVTSIGDSAFV